MIKSKLLATYFGKNLGSILKPIDLCIELTLMRRRGRRFLPSLCLFASFGLHFILFLLVFETSRLNEPSLNSRSKARIRPVQRIGMSLHQKLSEHATQKHHLKNKFSEVPLKKSKSLAQKSTDLKPSRVKDGETALSRTSRARLYSDFLPPQVSATNLDSLEREDDHKKVEAKFGESGGETQDFTSMPALIQFAHEFSDWLTVPSSLKAIQGDGEARLSISRNGGHRWKISKLVGDDFTRALVFDAFSQLPALTNSLVRLSEEKVSQFELIFRYQDIESPDLDLPPPKIRVEHRKIFLTYQYPTSNPAWKLVTPTPSGTALAINLLGIAQTIIQPYIEKDPYLDLEIRKLRVSPAFIKPIGH